MPKMYRAASGTWGKIMMGEKKQKHVLLRDRKRSQSVH